MSKLNSARKISGVGPHTTTKVDTDLGRFKSRQGNPPPQSICGTQARPKLRAPTPPYQKKKKIQRFGPSRNPGYPLMQPPFPFPLPNKVPAKYRRALRKHTAFSTNQPRISLKGPTVLGTKKCRGLVQLQSLRNTGEPLDVVQIFLDMPGFSPVTVPAKYRRTLGRSPDFPGHCGWWKGSESRLQYLPKKRIALGPLPLFPAHSRWRVGCRFPPSRLDFGTGEIPESPSANTTFPENRFHRTTT